MAFIYQTHNKDLPFLRQITVSPSLVTAFLFLSRRPRLVLVGFFFGFSSLLEKLEKLYLSLPHWCLLLLSIKHRLGASKQTTVRHIGASWVV